MNSNPVAATSDRNTRLESFSDYQRWLKLIADLGQLSDGGLDTITRNHGREPFKLGSLSVDEMSMAASHLGLSSVSIMVLFQSVDKAFFNKRPVNQSRVRSAMADTSDKDAVIILLVELKHYITVFNCGGTHCYYDPLGRPFHFYFSHGAFADMHPRVVDRYITQGQLNTTCGLYCLCQLWCTFKLRNNMSRWLSPYDVFQRDYMVLLFAFHNAVTPPQLSEDRDVARFSRELRTHGVT
jgi:hypothetical protein